MNDEQKTFEELNTIIDNEGNKFIIVDKDGLIEASKEVSYSYISIENKKNILHLSKKEMEDGRFKIYKPSQEEYKKSVQVVKEQYEKMESNYYKLKSYCSHNIINKYDSAICEFCDKDYGWYCPDSPDNVCHYHSDNGRVQLINGANILLPSSYNSTHESYDWCIFCGDPSERK